MTMAVQRRCGSAMRCLVAALCWISVAVLLVRNISWALSRHAISVSSATTDVTEWLQAAATTSHNLSSFEQRIEYYKKYYHYTPPNATAVQAAAMDAVVVTVDEATNESLTRDELCGTDAPEYATFFQRSYNVRSQYKEDETVYRRVFQGHLFGNETFVELGAYNGLKLSNSHFFDACLQFPSGLLIEAMPRNYAKVLHARPRTHRMSFAPTCPNVTTPPQTIEFYDCDLAGSGLPEHAQKCRGSSTLQVPCGPLGPVLQDVFPNHKISFFSLDVENSELLVLQTIDFAKVEIHVLMVEVWNNFCRQHCPARDQVRAFMKSVGYQRHEGVVAHSDLYLHPSSPYQLQPAPRKRPTRSANPREQVQR